MHFEASLLHNLGMTLLFQAEARSTYQKHPSLLGRCSQSLTGKANLLLAFQEDALQTFFAFR